MSSGRKSILTYYGKQAAKTILTCAKFSGLRPEPSPRHDPDMMLSCFAAKGGVGLPATELAAAALRSAVRAAAGRLARTFGLVAEYQPPLFQIVGRHLDGDAIPRERLDAVLLHLACGVGNDLVPGIQLHAVARVGEDFGDQSFELDQLFFRHV